MSTQRPTFFVFEKSHSDLSRQQIEIPLMSSRCVNDQQQYCLAKQITKIGDASFHPKKATIDRWTRFCKELDRRLPVVKPDSLFAMIWTMFNIIAIYGNFIEMPIILFMSDAAAKRNMFIIDTPFFKAFNWLSFTVFILDLLLVRHSLGLFHNGKLLFHHKQVLEAYLPYGFLADLVGLVGFIPYLIPQMSDWWRVLFLIKILTLIELDSTFESGLSIHGLFHSAYRFLRMTGIVYFVASFAACAYFGIDYYFYEQQGYNWQHGLLWLNNSPAIDSINLIELLGWQDWYIYALYWAAQTSSSVGYGSMTPRNPTEVLFNNLVMFVTVTLFVFFVNTVLDIAYSITHLSRNSQQHRQTLASYLDNMKVQSHAKQQSQQYIKRMQNYPEDQNHLQIEELLTDSLKVRFNTVYNRGLLDLLPMFELLNLHQHREWQLLQMQLANCTKRIDYSLDDVVYDQGQLDQPALYFLERGQVLICVPEGQAAIYVQHTQHWNYVQQFHFFNQEYFFLQGRTRHSAKCLDYCRVSSLNKKDFLHTIRQHSELYESYCSIVHDAIIQGEKLHLLEINCPRCCEPHSLHNCAVNRLWRKILRLESAGQLQNNQRNTQLHNENNNIEENQQEIKQNAHKIEYNKPIIQERYPIPRATIKSIKYISLGHLKRKKLHFEKVVITKTFKPEGNIEYS